MLRCARALDRRAVKATSPRHPNPEGQRWAVLPGEDYDRRGPDWSDLLTPHGWNLCRQQGAVRYWTRPGKDSGVSASTGLCHGSDGCELLHVFTTNGGALAEGNYGRFRTFAVLNHAGDLSAAARALMAQGYGRADAAEVVASPTAPSTEAPPPGEDHVEEASPVDSEDTATGADLEAAEAVMRWEWDGWLPRGVLTALASDGGIGKTRLAFDLARRIYHGMPWPDGSPPAFPPRSRCLWVPADQQHSQLTAMAREMGVPPEGFLLNTCRTKLYEGTQLDSRDAVKELEARIRKHRPAVVFIDTVGGSTDRNCTRPEEAKAFYVPLAEIAQRQGVAIVCMTHLSASGKTLGVRIRERCRVVWHLSRPDPDEPNRRKLWVDKTWAKLPDPLGVTMGDAGNDYDDNPPEEPEVEEPGKMKKKKASPKLDKCKQWLPLRVAGDSVLYATLRDEAEAKGFASATFHKALKELGIIKEDGAGGRLYCRFPDADMDGSD